MQIMDPKVQDKIRSADADVKDGLEVSLYLDGWKCQVANGTINGTAANSKNVRVELDLSNTDNVFAPGTLVNVNGPAIVDTKISIVPDESNKHTFSLYQVATLSL
jgi:hypothetical protein